MLLLLTVGRASRKTSGIRTQGVFHEITQTVVIRVGQWTGDRRIGPFRRVKPPPQPGGKIRFDHDIAIDVIGRLKVFIARLPRLHGDLTGAGQGELIATRTAGPDMATNSTGKPDVGGGGQGDWGRRKDLVGNRRKIDALVGFDHGDCDSPGSGRSNGVRRHHVVVTALVAKVAAATTYVLWVAPAIALPFLRH